MRTSTKNTDKTIQQIIFFGVTAIISFLVVYALINGFHYISHTTAG